MKYWQRLSIFICIDSFIILFSILFAQLLVNGGVHVSNSTFMVTSSAIILSYSFLFYYFKLYKKAWEYASLGELMIIFKTVTITTLVSALLSITMFGGKNIRVIITAGILQFLIISGSRFCIRLYRDLVILNQNPQKRTLVIGAGSAGTMVARQLLHNKDSELLPIGFIDDNIKKQNLQILGIPVIGGVMDIEKIVETFQIEHIVIAIPSLSRRELNTIFQECLKTKVKTQILPMIEDLVSGKVSVNQFRDVQVEDLLGRMPVELDTASIADSITNKVVLVTGAGGSIGSEICRQAAKFKPAKLILLGHGENSIYSIEMELKETYKNEPIEIIPEIADLQDSKKMMSVMEEYHPHVVYHAAAHKHVPLMERNPEEAVKNNLIGTINAANAASWHNVDTFVMISSDKAVNPTSVMGATKRLSEMVIQQMNKESETKFVVVRFGNVLGSRGSVIPLFKKQIANGGPVTVTHPEMIRYFMTIPEASRLVIQAGALANGGEIFVLDMGEPVKIVDLAENLIKLSGHTVEDIGIEFTGIRPGEKLYEELLKDEEVLDRQIYPKIFIGRSTNLYLQEIEELIAEYSSLEKEELRERLLNLANHRLRVKRKSIVASLSS
ncbi:polysaccharide biosynthesis protein [Falsibacillus pallidus]|uniref:FlaA1/EpsC-like NDP-sugar epimerase n=1 Tax=Falsibacillus pallidus TaxID=493781 RepID=A0A370GUU7_9BACI|nr:nucleoside-diphosphate sugar epimerase/dehydratase [Falsibacillus pallidus]RDI45703.1 FlaA1/EpsC-like NDP-sugar epimerase [Falsibacillus pallidus]